MQGECFLGVDAGGTATRAVVFHPRHGVVGEGYSGPGNIWAVGMEEALRAFEHAIAHALGEAGLHPGELRAACFGVAGLHSSRDRWRLQEALAPFAFPQPLLLRNDLEIAHAGGLGGRCGIHLVAGTGSAAWGENEEGAVARAGGWGWRLDDPGSAYWLGTRALRAIFEEEDGRGAPTDLREAVFDAWHIIDISEVLDRIEDPRNARAYIAELATPLIRCAEDDDPVARAIVARGADELARLVLAVARRLGMEGAGRPLEISFSGGTFQSDFYVKAFEDSVASMFGSAAKPQHAEYSPLAGAVLTSLHEFGVKADADALRQLRLRV